jgi:hypothetical protein
MPRTAGFMLRDDRLSGWNERARNPERFPYTPGAPAIYFDQIKSTILKNTLIVPMMAPHFWRRIGKFMDAQERFQYAQAMALNAAVNLNLPSHLIEGWK